MKCLRCGYCCVVYAVVLPNGDFKQQMTECEFLEWDEDKATCTIHDQPGTLEYKGEEIRYKWSETPCGQHGQTENSPDDECRMGRYMRDRGMSGLTVLEERP